MYNVSKAFTSAVLLNCDFLSDPAVYENAYHRIAVNRQQKTDQYKRDEDKRLSVGIGLLSQHLCRKYNLAENSVHYQEDGKPFIPGNNLYISFSHSDHYALAAISSSPVGVDVEHFNPDALNIANHFFTSDEKEYLNELTGEARNERFYIMWSEKECMIKRDGLRELRDFSVLQPKDDSLFTSFPIPDYSCVIYSHKDIPVTFEHMTEKDAIKMLDE